MNKTVLIFTSLLVSNLAPAVDLDEGKDLYEEDCTKCHDSSVFTRPAAERKVNDIATLKKQVHRCVAATGASWFDEDEENVVAYLNENFYKLAKAKESE
jgi:hypothetical protein